jgi:hypothetical protein
MQDDNVLEAAAILFRIARSYSSDYTERQLNSPSVRKELTKKIMNTAKEENPEVPLETWQKASIELTNRG